jgi:dethiobiotin synthetase
VSAYFITGTDTGVGKTWATLALMKALQNSGEVVVGMKPIASGCTKTVAGLRNDDAVKILELTNKKRSPSLEYKTINSYAFEPAVAPHIAADWSGEKIDIEKIADDFNFLHKEADSVLVEGVGGWSVPLGGNEMLVDMVRRLDLSVILVIGLRLGCINHALSTSRAIQSDGVKLQGWMTSQIDQAYAGVEETMDTFHSRINAPYLGSLPYMKKFDLDFLAGNINLRTLKTLNNIK